jgi:hypothetical protein
MSDSRIEVRVSDQEDIGGVIQRCAGFALADATCALARVFQERSGGSPGTGSKAVLVDQIVRLHRLHNRAAKLGMSLRSFAKSAQQQGMKVLRERIGPKR